MGRKLTSFQSKKLLSLLVSVPKRFASLVTKIKSSLIKLYQGIENLIKVVCKRCVITYLLFVKYPKIREQILSMLEFHQKSKLTTLIDKLNSSRQEDLNTAHLYLLQMLLQELISAEKACQHYWTPAYKELSEKLLLPIKTDCQGLDSNLLTPLLQRQEEKLQSLTIKEISLQNKSCQKTYYQLSTSTVVGKWEKEAIKEKTIQKSLKIKINLNQKQKQVINEWINTSNYVYNKTIEYVNKGHKPNFYNLRDLLVTKNTKKNNDEYKEQENKIKELLAKRQTFSDTSEIDKEIEQNKKLLRQVAKSLSSSVNTVIEEWEFNTPKDVRAGAVNDVCKAYKTAFSNLKLNNILHFQMKFRKHYNTTKSIVISKAMISYENNCFKLAPTYLKDDCKFKVGKRMQNKKIEIEGDCRLLKQNNEYWMIIPVTIQVKDKQKPINYCGIDPGVRTFMTSFGNNGCYEYHYNKVLLDKLNKSIFYLKSLRIKECHNKRKSLNKREAKKTNIINELHWKTINHLLKTNDIIHYGNIKSHNIVKNGSNNTLNQTFNDLKFYQFKQRLQYKAKIESKQVYEVNEAYTSQCCSNCGTINKVGASKVYSCNNCKSICDRDINAAKNILLKGIITYL